jgi:hypothetical protein
MVTDDRLRNVPRKNDRIADKVYYPDELQESIPSPALMAYLANVAMFGANYADSKIGMRQVRGAHNLTDAGKAKWRAQNVHSCGYLLPVSGNCTNCT